MPPWKQNCADRRFLSVCLLAYGKHRAVAELRLVAKAIIVRRSIGRPERSSAAFAVSAVEQGRG